MSYSFIGLCRQYLILHCLLKGLKISIDFATQTAWLNQLIAAYRDDRNEEQSQPSSSQ